MKKTITIATLAAFLSACTCGEVDDSVCAGVDSGAVSADLVFDAADMPAEDASAGETGPEMVFTIDDVPPPRRHPLEMFGYVSPGYIQSKLVDGCGMSIALVGDSLTAGANYNVSLKRFCGAFTEIKNNQTYPPTRYRNRQQDIYAAWGRTTTEMRALFEKVLDTEPETIILIGGTNNIGYRSQGAQIVIDDLESMIYDGQARGIRMVSATILPIAPDRRRKMAGYSDEREQKLLKNIHTLNQWILSDLNPADIAVDLYTPFLAKGTRDDADPELFWDGLHPTEDGQAKMAKILYKAMRQ